MGTFDGVHCGHQRLLAVARRRANALGGDVLAVAFDRPPRLFFSPQPGPVLLTTPLEKEALLRSFGADRVISLPFTNSMSVLSPDAFLEKRVVKNWNASEIVVGFNFQFGRGREGDAAYLKRWARAAGMNVHLVPPVTRGGRVVSSGRIRPLVAVGNLDGAVDLLGHPFVLEATVRSGRGVGITLGFPTANLAVPDEKILPSGVWAVAVRLPTGIDRKGVLNVGVRPTFGGKSNRSAEVHIVDFSGDLRGRPLRLEFINKIRNEKKFPSVKALVRQIEQDVQKVSVGRLVVKGARK